MTQKQPFHANLHSSPQYSSPQLGTIWAVVTPTGGSETNEERSNVRPANCRAFLCAVLQRLAANGDRLFVTAFPSSA